MSKNLLHIGVQVDVASFQKTLRDLGASPRRIRVETKRALLRTGLRVERLAKRQAPVGDTGRLRASIMTTDVYNDEIMVGTNVSYAGAIDGGSKPHDIRAKRVKALTIPLDARMLVRTDLAKKRGFVSRSQRDKKGRAKVFKRVQYVDAPDAPNKRHMDVEFMFVGRAKHPGIKKKTPFLTDAAKEAGGIAAKEMELAIKKATEAKHG